MSRLLNQTSRHLSSVALVRRLSSSPSSAPASVTDRISGLKAYVHYGYSDPRTEGLWLPVYKKNRHISYRLFAERVKSENPGREITRTLMDAALRQVLRDSGKTAHHKAVRKGRASNTEWYFGPSEYWRLMRESDKYWKAIEEAKEGAKTSAKESDAEAESSHVV